LGCDAKPALGCRSLAKLADLPGELAGGGSRRSVPARTQAGPL